MGLSLVGSAPVGLSLVGSAPSGLEPCNRTNPTPIMESQVASLVPIDKVAFPMYAGAIGAIIVWVLETYAKLEIPPHISAAIVVIIQGTVGYFVPLRTSEIKDQNGDIGHFN